MANSVENATYGNDKDGEGTPKIAETPVCSNRYFDLCDTLEDVSPELIQKGTRAYKFIWCELGDICHTWG